MCGISLISVLAYGQALGFLSGAHGPLRLHFGPLSSSSATSGGGRDPEMDEEEDGGVQEYEQYDVVMPVVRSHYNLCEMGGSVEGATQ